jgi:hypothetical protein
VVSRGALGALLGIHQIQSTILETLLRPRHPQGIQRGDIPEFCEGLLLRSGRSSISSQHIHSSSRAALHQLSGEGKDAQRPWSGRRSGRRGTTVALLQLVERRTDKTHQTGPLLTQSVTGVVELPRRQILPDRRLDGTALSVAPQGELRSERPSMEIGVTVRKHDEASANEVTR